MPFMRSESCSFIWHPKVVTWKRFMPSSSVVGRPGLPDHGHLDLAGVLELLLDLAGDLVAEQDRAVVVERAGDDHHADLAARLHGVDLVDAVVAGGALLVVSPAPYVLLQRLTPGAPARAGEPAGGPDEHALHRPWPVPPVVGVHPLPRPP